MLTARRTLDEVRMRGRWQAEQSVRRYLKHTCVLKEEAALPRGNVQYALDVENNLSNLLAGKWRPPPAPAIGLPRLPTAKWRRRE